MAADIIGFEDPGSGTAKQDGMQKKQKKKGVKSGGFQNMGLSYPVIQGIQKRGYKLPTPIQRKAIPIILQGRDTVAMARTGSGKTACFLIPLFEKLKARAAQTGARALVLSPTRELALQTLKFIKELGKFSGLKAAVILGGDSMDNQFSAIHGNPDIIVATPGRFLHICVEMELKLNSVEYVVFDEADRLFEMGFGSQLRDIVNRLPDSRQTVLFSATLPKMLVEFAKAGLSDPVLIRLDVESKLPDLLKLAFICCRPEEKLAILLCILKQVVQPKSQTMVFAATKHHVDYLHVLLDKAQIPNTFIYSSLDPSARKINAAKFQTGKVNLLLVTDVAARGIDIPLLDNVINFNFPAKSKLFVHRVGRCARAGRSGTAFSLVASEECPYLLDLHLFLGRPLKLATLVNTPAADWNGMCGKVSQGLLDEEESEIHRWHEESSDLANLKKVCCNAYTLYLKSRPGASAASAKRVKELSFEKVGVHPVFSAGDASESEKFVLLDKMKNYRPSGTIFEIGPKASSSVYSVMKGKREKHERVIESHHKMLEDKEKQISDLAYPGLRVPLPDSNADDISGAFHDVIASKKYKLNSLYHAKKRKRSTVDSEHYVPYTAPDHHTEEGLAINGFHREAMKAVMDLTADDGEVLQQQRKISHWDSKKKKMVFVNNKDNNRRKIKTESGVWIPATYKSKRYEEWKQRSKQEDSDNDDDDDDGNGEQKFPTQQFGRRSTKLKKEPSDLKRPEQILKARKLKEQRMRLESRRRDKKRRKRAKRKS